jgi:SAM-dependent methyltransferase
MAISAPIDPVTALKNAHRATWASGDYPAIAEHIDVTPPAAAVAAARVAPGSRVLDVATGSGNAALAAAGLGAWVTGLDLVPELLDVAAERAAAERFRIQLVVGDAEALPFVDGTFDRVLSVFGVQFAPRHQQVADELVRVTVPGGRIGLVNWTPDGMIGRLLKAVGRYMPPPPDFASPPPLWGSEDHVDQLFSDHDVEVTYEHGTNRFEAASAEAFTTLFETRYGPLLKVREKLTAEGTWGDLRPELVELFESYNYAGDGTYEGLSEYLVVTVERRDA